MKHPLHIVGFIRLLLRQRAGTALIEFALVFPFLFILIFGAIELTRYVLINQKLEKATWVVSGVVTREPTATKATPTVPASGVTVAELQANAFPNFDSTMGVYGCCGPTQTTSEGVIVTSIYKYGPGEKAGCNIGTEPDCLRVQWQMGYLPPGSAPGGSAGEWTSAITGIGITQRGAMLGLCNAARVCQQPTGAFAAVGTQPLTGEEQANIQNMIADENMIVTESFYQYQPLLEPLLTRVSPAPGEAPFSVASTWMARRIFAYPREGDLKDLPPDFHVP